MDVTKAVIVIATVFGITEFVKAIGPASWYDNVNAKVSARASAITALAVGQAAVFLVAATVWANSEVINGKQLDQLNIPSKILAGLVVAGVAAFGQRVIDMGKNFGENQVQKPVAK